MSIVVAATSNQTGSFQAKVQPNCCSFGTATDAVLAAIFFTVVPADDSLPTTGQETSAYPDFIPESELEEDDNGLVTVVDGFMPGRFAAVVNARVVQREAQAAAALDGELQVTWQKKRQGWVWQTLQHSPCYLFIKDQQSLFT